MVENTETVTRRYTFKAYPSKAQAEALERHRVLHCRLYNAALQERIDCYRLTGKSLSQYDQSRHIKIVRKDDLEYAAMNCDSLHMTLKRVERAFQAFFRRAKQGAGAKSGFPKFKSAKHYPGFTVRLTNTHPKPKPTGPRSWAFWLKGVGQLKLRGCLPRGVVKEDGFAGIDWRTADFIYRDGNWWLSVVIKCAPRREGGKATAYLHWDVNGFSLHAVSENGGCAAAPEDEKHSFSSAEGGTCPQNSTACEDIGSTNSDFAGQPQARSAPNVRHARSTNSDFAGQPQGRKAKVLEAGQRVQQRKAARCKKGSVKWRKRMNAVARIKAKQARQRSDWMHNVTTHLASDHSEIRISDAMVSEFTKSGRGNEKRWGAAVKDKALGNRAILDFAPAEFISTLEYKLAEGGGELVRISVDEADTLKARFRDLPAAVIAARSLNRLVKQRK